DAPDRPEPAAGRSGVVRGVRLGMPLALQLLPHREHLGTVLGRPPGQVAAEVEGEPGLGPLESPYAAGQLQAAARVGEPARGEPGTTGGQRGQLALGGHLRSTGPTRSPRPARATALTAYMTFSTTWKPSPTKAP